MNDKILFIESNTSGSGMQAIEIAKQLNLDPVLFTNNSQRYLGLENTNCHVIQCDPNNFEEIKSLINKEVNSHNIKGITTTSEFYIGVVSELCEHFGFISNNQMGRASGRERKKI